MTLYFFITFKVRVIKMKGGKTMIKGVKEPSITADMCTLFYTDFSYSTTYAVSMDRCGRVFRRDHFMNFYKKLLDVITRFGINKQNHSIIRGKFDIGPFHIYSKRKMSIVCYDMVYK